MPFIKQALDAKEPEAAPEDEYDLRIIKVDPDATTKKGDPMIICTIAFQDRGLNAPPFNHYLLPIGKNTKPENHELYKLNMQRFLTAFGVPFEDGGFDTDDLQGAEGRSFVIQQEGDDGIIRNALRLPRMDK